MFDAGKFAGVARVEPGGMCVSGSCDQQIHHTRSRLTAGSHNGGSKLPVAPSVVTSTPKCSSAMTAALIASSPCEGGTSVTIKMLVSRMA